MYSSCDDEYFVETRLRKLCVILRSRLLRVYHGTRTLSHQFIDRNDRDDRTVGIKLRSSSHFKASMRRRIARLRLWDTYTARGSFVPGAPGPQAHQAIRNVMVQKTKTTKPPETKLPYFSSVLH